ncbi:glycosyltransferase family 4 protein [Rhizobium sp. RU36D]|uniref:glycosyltransferase family 4 protein n=1 Tax=Rhizobium sp. RU36D TaxID=1907415 RepID=UPI0009D829CB|nr:glycosyltransferase family 4 protein [Rhizobium sp. RU36D]SMC53102.1 Glycosyltransferase involved in cell wall bisynthesis [Rhizobium sp. RU36D]
MSQSLVFAYPGNLELKTGGYAYDRRVIEGLRAGGWSITLLSLGEGFPVPTADVLDEAERRLSALADGTLLVIDGLAFGVLDGWAERHAHRFNLVALVHHPLALETGIDSAEQERLRRSEVKALSFARHVIVTSPMTARELEATYGVEPQRMTVAVPGTERAAISPGNGDPPHILSIGTLTPRKAHDVLIAALKRVEHLPWRATIIGSRTLSPQTAASLQHQLDSSGLSGRITLAGETDDVRAELARADIFALASRYEGYGMVFAEALSQGLPIVACQAGAIPDVVPEEAGFLVPVDDVEAFAAALERLLSDPVLRHKKAKAALAAGARLPSWNDTTEIFANLLRTVQ